MDLQKLLKIYSDNHCKKVYVKKLSPNDNSKNQVYLGGSFDVLNILPVGEIMTDSSGNWERDRYKSKIDFYWITENGDLSVAPEAQLILYPKYPEVRFSGFLQRSKEAPSDLMRVRTPNRILFLGISDNGRVLGFVDEPDSKVANGFDKLKGLPSVAVFKEIALENGVIQHDTKQKLLAELKRINSLGWIDSRRLNAQGFDIPCISSNCGGYTLEAELGIKPNGYSEPDYLGWEVKQFGVRDFNKWQSEVITLMTPEPTDGFYVKKGVESFIRKYGYTDKLGREARLNFGGIYKYNVLQPTTKLKLILSGFDAESGKITKTDGFIGLIDIKDNIAAAWSFSSLLKHWNRKHANACFVPSKNRKGEEYLYSRQQYCYGNNIALGTGTDFTLMLKQISVGNLYYDPGIKLELAIDGKRKQNIKRRSQFRIKSANLKALYKSNEVINLNN